MTTIYSFPRTVTLDQIKVRINDIYGIAVSTGMSHTDICNRLAERLWQPLGERYPSGKAKHNKYLQGYAYGLVEAWRDQIWRHHVEFCYLLDGELYSTHRESLRKRTCDVPDASVFCDCESAHYWKDFRYGDKIY